MFNGLVFNGPPNGPLAKDLPLPLPPLLSGDPLVPVILGEPLVALAIGER